MTKKPTESTGIRSAIQGMSRENSAALWEALRAKYGDAAGELTLREVQERHADLLERLDGERRVAGMPLSDEGMDMLTHAIEVGTTVKTARDQMAKKLGKN